MNELNSIYGCVANFDCFAAMVRAAVVEDSPFLFPVLLFGGLVVGLIAAGLCALAASGGDR